MSTPNPVVAAAIPTLISAVELFQTAFNTTLTGDPLQIPARAAAALLILEGQLGLLLPGFAGSEVSAINSSVQSGFANIITKLKAMQPPAA